MELEIEDLFNMLLHKFNNDRELIIKNLDIVIEKERERKRIEEERERKRIEDEKKRKIKSIKNTINSKINTFKNINYFVFLIDNEYIEGIDEIIPKKDNLNLCIFNGRIIKFYTSDEKWKEYILSKHGNITLINNEYIFTIDEIYSNKFFEEVEKTHFDYLRENDFIKDDSDDDYDMSKMYEENGIEW